MKKISFLKITAILLMALSGFNSVAKVESQFYFPYINPTPGHFPIVACDPAIQDNIPTPAELKRAADCGFNIGQRAYDPKVLPTIFGNAENTGMKIVVRGADLIKLSACERVVNSFKNNPGLAFWQLYDEPKTRELIKKLGEISNLIYKNDPNHLIFTNLLPEVNSNEARYEFKDTVINGKRIEAYDVYINFVKENLRPAVWAYDYYPIRANYKKNTETFNDKFFTLLKKFADVAAETKRPFWFYVVSTGEYTAEDFNYNIPNPTMGSIRLLANSALAYGAKGLAYWTYCQRPENNIADQKTLAPVNLKNQTTEVWNYVKEENTFIRKYENIFLNSEFVDCCFTGKSIPAGNKKLNKAGFGPIKTLESENAGVLVSILKQGDLKFLTIVNRDYKRKQSISITFKDDRKIKQIISSKKEKAYNNTSKADKTNKIKLLPGEMYIFPYFD